MKKVLVVLFLVVAVSFYAGAAHAINLNFDWDCNGSDGVAKIALNGNGTFSADGVPGGTWGLEPGGGLGWLNAQTGCMPLYSFDLTTGRGVMKCTEGTMGTMDPGCAWIKAMPNRLEADPSAGTESRGWDGAPK